MNADKSFGDCGSNANGQGKKLQIPLGLLRPITTLESLKFQISSFQTHNLYWQLERDSDNETRAQD